jgi:hypothetical protein
MMIRSIRPFIGLAILLAGATAVHGWMRQSYDAAIVVERSELIVVGRLARESIRYVPHKDAGRGQSWEHHATLLVSEVLKGKEQAEEIPIVIHYGLGPHVAQDGTVGILDSGNSAKSFSPLIKDALADNLWFLRKRAGIYGREPGTGKYGIVDPEDVLSYLDPNPESAVAEYARRNPGMSRRAKIYLDHLEVQRRLQIEDPSERFEKLLPYFLSRRTWNGKWEAREGIVSSGPVAGEKLKTLFVDPGHPELREEIMRVWHDLEFRDAAPILIKLLSDADQFWKSQRLEKGWWSPPEEGSL